MERFIQTIQEFFTKSGFAGFFADGGWKNLIMIAIALVLIFLAIKKDFEPYLLLPIGFAMLLVNIPFAGNELLAWDENNQGLISFLQKGLPIYPCLIFLCIGATTDFGPLIANKKTMLLGAAAQLGIFATFIGAIALGFTPQQASSIGIIGGADGPTAILVTNKLAPEMLGTIAVVAYSYMALVPIIQPPIIRLLTTKKERQIKMETPREVSKREKIIFPIIFSILCILGWYGNGLLLVIEPEEAKIVKKVFELYLSGMGANLIAIELNKLNLKSSFKGKFSYATVRGMLLNKTYTGDLLLQTTYRENFITKKTLKNNGQKRMWLVEDAHEPIIDKETFNKVQIEIQRTKNI